MPYLGRRDGSSGREVPECYNPNDYVSKGILRMGERTEAVQRGYTDESICVLESEEGQLNAVFACYGSAAQHAQLFEQGLARFLVIYNKITSDSIGVDDVGHKMTMGQLLNKLRQHVTIDDNSVEEWFDAALKERNYLIHRFFLERDQGLKSAEGRMELLAELVKIEANLNRCRVMINAMRIAMCRTLDIVDNWADDYSSR